jgi:molybdopterin-binding protein
MTPPLGMRYAAVDTTEVTMKLSARNVLKGRILAIDKGAVTSHVRLDIGGSTVTSSITNEAVEELGLKIGMDAYAVIKASDVMVAVD